MFRYKIVVMSSANRSRKYESGYQKRKKKQRIEDLTQSQKGAMDKFVRKESQVSTDNQSLGQGQGTTLDNNDDNDPRDGQIETENIVESRKFLLITQTLKWITMLITLGPIVLHQLRMLMIPFSLIYLILDIGIPLIINKLIF